MSSFVLVSFAISTIIYPVYANWVWGGGWLSQMGVNFGLGHGHVDFAGSSVVHMTGGVMAIVLAKMIGPRAGKYTPDGRIHPIAPHSIPQVLLGTFILAFGWFGFNAGSTLSGMDTRLAVVATNTMIAGATGAFAAFLYVKVKWGKADPSWLANGMLAGLRLGRGRDQRPRHPRDGRARVLERRRPHADRRELPARTRSYRASDSDATHGGPPPLDVGRILPDLLGCFRAMEIEVPPLRERIEDVVPLALALAAAFISTDTIKRKRRKWLGAGERTG